MTKEYLHAEFASAEAAAGAIESLCRAGMSKAAMELYSRRPVETHPPLLPRPSRMSLGAVLGGIAVGSGATGLVFWMQLDYPLVTGGMPITSGWATAVLTFETTMAGAVLGTVLTMLWESGLVGPKKGAPVPPLPDQGVVLQVACGDGTERDLVKGRLTDAGAASVYGADPGRQSARAEVRQIR